MITHLVAAAFISLWALLMLKLHKRALRLHRVAQQKKLHPHATADPAEPMAVRVKMAHN